MKHRLLRVIAAPSLRHLPRLDLGRLKQAATTLAASQRQRSSEGAEPLTTDLTARSSLSSSAHPAPPPGSQPTPSAFPSRLPRVGHDPCRARIRAALLSLAAHTARGGGTGGVSPSSSTGVVSPSFPDAQRGSARGQLPAGTGFSQDCGATWAAAIQAQLHSMPTSAEEDQDLLLSLPAPPRCGNTTDGQESESSRVGEAVQGLYIGSGNRGCSQREMAAIRARLEHKLVLRCALQLLRIYQHQ